MDGMARDVEKQSGRGLRRGGHRHGIEWDKGEKGGYIEESDGWNAFGPEVMEGQDGSLEVKQMSGGAAMNKAFG